MLGCLTSILYCGNQRPLIASSFYQGGSRDTASTTMTDPVGDFYVHILQGTQVDTQLTSSTKLLTEKNIPSVISFYDGG